MKPQDIKYVLQRHIEMTLHDGAVIEGYICTWIDATDQIDTSAGYSIVVKPTAGNLQGRLVEIGIEAIASYRIIQKQTA